MAHHLTLPVLAGLAIVGAAGGLQLGKSAVAEINPAYFSDPDSDFYADLVPNRSPVGGADWGAVQQVEYENARSAQGLGTGCINCRTYPVEYAPRQDSAVALYDDGWRPGLAAEDYAEPAEEVVYVQAAPDPRLVQVERYTRYRVSADEPEFAAAPEPQPAVVETAEAPLEASGEPTGL